MRHFLTFHFRLPGNPTTCNALIPFYFTPLCPCPTNLLCLKIHLLFFFNLASLSYFVSRFFPVVIPLESLPRYFSYRSLEHPIWTPFIALIMLLHSSCPSIVRILGQDACFHSFFQQIFTECLLGEHGTLDFWFREVSILMMCLVRGYKDNKHIIKAILNPD